MKKIGGWDLMRFDPEETDTVLGLMDTCKMAIEAYGNDAELTFMDPRPAGVAKKALVKAKIRHEVVWVAPDGRGIFSCSAADVRDFLSKYIKNHTVG